MTPAPTIADLVSKLQQQEAEVGAAHKALNKSSERVLVTLPVCDEEQERAFGSLLSARAGVHHPWLAAISSPNHDTPPAVAGVRPEQLARVDSLRDTRRQAARHFRATLGLPSHGLVFNLHSGSATVRGSRPMDRSVPSPAQLSATTSVLRLTIRPVTRSIVRSSKRHAGQSRPL